MISEITEGLKEHKKKISKWQYDRMCSFHRDYFMRRVNEKIPEVLTKVGEQYSNQVARSKIHSQVVPIKSNACDDAKPIGDFSSKFQKQIWDQLTSENCHYDVEDHNFVISNFHPDVLPLTVVEYGIYDKYISDEDMMYDMKKVNRIAENIEKEYDDNYPLMLLYHDKPFSSVDLWGGNHRLQAVRNLMEENKLPKDFTLPAVIICPKRVKIL